MKSIKLCIAAMAASVSALGSRGQFNPDKIFGQGDAYEAKFKEAHHAERLSRGLSAMEEKFMTTDVDHFNNTDTRTFQMRYLIDQGSYNETSGPILFYAGNEGGIMAFYENSGFMTKTLAESLNATVVFAEHRFYGKSMPFGNNTF